MGMGKSSLNSDRALFGKCYCYPGALQCLHQGPRDLDLSSAGDWKVLKALAKAGFSKLPCVDQQPSGLLDSQAVAGSLGSLAQLAASEPSPGSREKEECHSVG